MQDAGFCSKHISFGSFFPCEKLVPHLRTFIVGREPVLQHMKTAEIFNFSEKPMVIVEFFPSQLGEKSSNKHNMHGNNLHVALQIKPSRENPKTIAHQNQYHAYEPDSATPTFWTDIRTKIMDDEIYEARICKNHIRVVVKEDSDRDLLKKNNSCFSQRQLQVLGTYFFPGGSWGRLFELLRRMEIRNRLVQKISLNKIM